MYLEKGDLQQQRKVIDKYTGNEYMGTEKYEREEPWREVSNDLCFSDFRQRRRWYSVPYRSTKVASSQQMAVDRIHLPSLNQPYRLGSLERMREANLMHPNGKVVHVKVAVDRQVLSAGPCTRILAVPWRAIQYGMGKRNRQRSGSSS
jgi:hypothetical protein